MFGMVCKFPFSRRYRTQRTLIIAGFFFTGFLGYAVGAGESLSLEWVAFKIAHAVFAAWLLHAVSAFTYFLAKVKFARLLPSGRVPSSGS